MAQMCALCALGFLLGRKVASQSAAAGKWVPRNGSNVRAMRTRFPPGEEDGESQRENRRGLGAGMRRQGAPGFSGEGVERVLTT